MKRLGKKKNIMANVSVTVVHDAEPTNNVAHHTNEFVEALKTVGHKVTSSVTHVSQTIEHDAKEVGIAAADVAVSGLGASESGD